MRGKTSLAKSCSLPYSIKSKTSREKTYIPVLTVPEYARSQPGFSTRSVIFPSSSVRQTPYSKGDLTSLRTTVAAPPCPLWKATAAPRSISVIASPLITRKAPSTSPSHAFTPPAVPSGSFSSMKTTFLSAQAFLICALPCRTVAMTSVIPFFLRRSNV